MADLTDEEAAKLIKLFRAHENLYNFTISNKSDREKSMLSVATTMNKGWDLKMTKARIKWLRNGYARNRSFVEKGKAVKWRWYHQLDSFLRPFTRLRSDGLSNMQLEEYSQLDGLEDFDDIDNQDLAIEDSGSERWSSERQNQLLHNKDLQSSESTCEKVTPRPCTPSNMSTCSSVESSGDNLSSSLDPPAPAIARHKRKRKHSEVTSETMNLLQEIAGYMRESTSRRKRQDAPRSDNEIYCIYLASRLDRLTRINQIKVRKRIDDIFFEVAIQELEAQESS
ncbi:uncharacterized protein LOC112571508 [Pomacea canaliculata]|uniref:uncharacterized protein LOC112571508 n=1 Tax=Pomacea canaliculata TaxID=400727 RepID=UPI000D72D39F|nr:uncharacterized protein LOC112571508 [Pomacea canaliculata]